MKTMTFWIVAGLVALAAPSGASAAPEPAPVPASEIISEAVKNNGELRALREELEIKAAEEAHSGLSPDPVLDLGVETGALTGSSGEDRYSVGISREFLTFGKGKYRRSVAGKELEAARARVENAERLLKLEVKERLYALLLAREKAALARRAARLDQELVRVAEERFAAGDIAEVEVELARVEAARARERVLAAERETAPHLAALAQLMGLPPAEVPGVKEELSTRKVTADPAPLTERALRERPDLRALSLDLEGSGAAVQLARAEGLPNVTAGLSYTHERSVTELGDLEEDSSDNLLGVRLSVPIPVPGRREALLRQAGARRGSAQQRLATLKSAVSREVQSACVRLESAGASVNLYGKEILPRLEQNLKTIQEAYRLGETGLLNVLEEQRKFQEVHSGYLQALYDLNHALATLEAAVGADMSDFEGEKR